MLKISMENETLKKLFKFQRKINSNEKWLKMCKHTFNVSDFEVALVTSYVNLTHAY